MTLLMVGYFPTTYWVENYWADDYWQDYAYVENVRFFLALEAQKGVSISLEAQKGASISLEALGG
jgi:hypothetical protein